MEIHIWSQVNDNVQSDSPLGAKPSFTSHYGSSLLNPAPGAFHGTSKIKTFGIELQ